MKTPSHCIGRSIFRSRRRAHFYRAAAILSGALMLAISPVLLGQEALDSRFAPENTNAPDPSEMYLKAFASVQQAQKLKTDGKLRAALAKYRFAANLLDQLSQSNPNWQPIIVRYRSRLTNEDIHKLEEQVTLEPAADRSSAAAVGSGEDDLPVPDNVPYTPGPRYADVPPAAAPAGEYIDRSTSELRAKLAKSEQQIKALVDALGNAKREKQDVLKQKQELEYQMQAARTSATLSQKRFDHIKTDRDDLQAQLDKTEARLKEALVKNPDATDIRKELREQIKTLKRSLAQNQTDVEAATKDRDALSKKIKESEDRNVQLTKERDAAVAQSNLTKDAADKINALETENAGLSKKLTAAESSIAQLTAESAKKREEVEGMQKELTTVRDQLASTRDKADRLETANTELNQQLAENSDKLAKLKASGKTDQDFDRMSKENDLLKSIVVRELRDEARRRQARSLVTEELARLDVQSSLLSQQVEELGRPTVQLTDEERALFKDPQVSISDLDSPSALAVRITAVKPRGSGEAAAATPAPIIDALPGQTPATAGGATEGAATAPLAGGDGATPVQGNTGGTAPKVETNFTPKVSKELQPMAKEAQEQFDRKHYVDAERSYSKLLARDPQNPYLLSNQGVVFFRQGKFKNAELVLKKAVALNANDAFAQATLGIVYYRMGRYDDAINNLTRAIQLDPKNATAHNYLGITSSQKGWPEAAVEEVQKAITLNPSYADAHFNIAVIYATTQPPLKDRAQEHYKIATQLGAAPDPTLEKLIQK